MAIRIVVWQESISKIENGLSGAKLETVFDILSALELEVMIDNRIKGSAKALAEIF